MRRLIDVFLLGGLALTTLLWRFAGAGDQAPWILLPAAVCLGLALARGRLGPAPRLLALLAGLATALSLLFVSGEIVVGPDTGPILRAAAALWPCDVACSGAGPYAAILGVPTWLPGLAAYLLLALAALVGMRRRRPEPAALLAWACVGCSVYFLVLSLHLRMLCPHCLAVHTVAICFVAGCLRGPLTWTQRIGVMLVAALGLHAAFHPFLRDAAPAATRDDDVDDGVTAFMQIGTDDDPADAGVLDDAELLYLSRADRGRRLGSDSAPYRADLLVAIGCPHCRTACHSLLRDWREPIRQERVQVVIGLGFWPEMDRDRFLARLALAAAARGEFGTCLLALLGTPAHLDRDAAVRRLARNELLDVKALVSEAEARARPLDRLLDLDLRRLDSLRRRRDTPVLRITGPRWPEGRIWQGEAVDSPAIGRLLVEGEDAGREP